MLDDAEQVFADALQRFPGHIGIAGEQAITKRGDLVTAMLRWDAFIVMFPDSPICSGWQVS